MNENNLQHKIFQLFRDFEIYLVGGSVRDLLLSNTDCVSSTLVDAKNDASRSICVNDLDFATNALPEQTKAILERAGYHPHTVGWAFGTVGIVDPPYEAHITTYRKNEDYQRDNRHPKVEWGKTIQEDLTRRDFTINALAQDRDGNIIDLFNGLQHLKDKLLETPIDADQAFSDDPLRMIRAIRFKAKLNFNYSERVKQALYNQAHRLLVLSKERIQEELNKILLTDNAASALEDLYQFRLLDYIIPELTMLSKVEQDSIYHSKNALLHTIEVLRNSPKDLILRYASIFHDLGKMVTRSVENGNVHFYHHESISALMTYSILHRLGLPKQWIKDIVYLVRNHMRFNLYNKDFSDSAIRRLIRDTEGYTDRLLSLSTADITSHNPTTIQSHLNSLKELRERIGELKNYKEIKPPLNGLEIMQEFNLQPGKEIGRLKNILLEGLIKGEINLGEDKQIYINYIKNNKQ